MVFSQGSAKLIEFEPLRAFNVTLPPGATFVVANTLEEKNKAASNDFNTRVVECRQVFLIVIFYSDRSSRSHPVRLSVTLVSLKSCLD